MLNGAGIAAGNDTTSPTEQAAATFPVPAMTTPPTDLQPLEYVDVGRQIPHYPPSEKWGVQEEPLSKMQKPLPAEESLRRMIVPQGFRVELFAAEPDIGGKPIAMAWDERGRLWLAETYDYPNELQPIGAGRDRIRILEDSDGDGRADTFTVFAEKLSIPTSIAFHRGGAIVQNGFETLYLKDLDGDDVADLRETIFTGWGIRDTHGGVSNFQYGLDNWIWAMQGYNESQPVVEGKPLAYSFRQGFFRFRPDGSELEFIRSTDNNTWGLGISEEGLIFGSTANRNPSNFMPIANRYYERVAGWTRSLTLRSIADTHLFHPITENIRQVDHHGGYTAGAGHALYTARAYPQEYWNRVAFVNGPTGHLVGAFVLQQDGAGFRSQNLFNLLASDDQWTAPIMAEVGPDGQVWVIDWYNYIVQHNPTPQGFETGKGMAYETQLRDKRHGRIYRVVYDSDQSPAPPLSLANATPQQLVAALSHPTQLWRKHAQRLLVERGRDDVARELTRLVQDQSVDSIGLNAGAIHALWTLKGLGLLDGTRSEATAAVIEALRHPSAGVRRNALKVLPSTPESTAAVLASGALDDENAQVRLAALLALADLPASEEAGREIFARLHEERLPRDRWLSDAVVAAAANNSASFLHRAATAEAAPESSGREIVAAVAEHYGRTASPGGIAALLAALGASQHDAMTAVVIDGLANDRPAEAAAPLSPAVEQSIRQLFIRLPPESQGRLLKIVGSWPGEVFREEASRIADELATQLDDASAPTDERIETARQFVQFAVKDDGVIRRLLSRIDATTDPTLAEGWLSALAASESPALGELLTDRLPSFTPQQRQAVVEVLFQREQGALALVNAIEERVLHLTELSLQQRQRLANHSDETIRTRVERLLEQGGSLPNQDRQVVLARLRTVASAEGDPVAGRDVFKKQCAACHMHRGEGSRIGPDLTGMASHPKLELLTHIIDPNRDIEGNYRVYAVSTIDGRTLSGLLASESKTMIELIDAEGKKHQLLREDLENLADTGMSLMPVGFEREVSEKELTDLLEYLTERGKFQALDIRAAATASTARGMFNSEEASAERIVLDDWTPRRVAETPFLLIDPEEGAVKNAIVLYGPAGKVSRQFPESVAVACDSPARAIHLLGGVSGWGYPATEEETCSLIVRLTYADGQTEEHPLYNGQHLVDYRGETEAPKSALAFAKNGTQVRYLSIVPGRSASITQIEFVKGEDRTAPIVLAVTLELP